MVRIIVGIVAGTVAAFAAVWLIDLGGHLIYPVPSDFALSDYEAICAYVRAMPPLALAIVAAAWFVGGRA